MNSSGIAGRHSTRFCGGVFLQRGRMRTMRGLGIVALCALSASACTQPPKDTGLRPMVSIGELMQSVVDPPADDLWGSVETVVTVAGEENKAPSNDEEWAKVRHDAVSVMEAMNLVVMEGRAVAKPGTKSENPGIELEPAEIQKLIDADRPALIALAHKLQDASAEAIAAIDKKDTNALIEAGAKMDEACENCHLKYWYPNDSPSKRGVGNIPTVGAKAVGESTPKPAAPAKP